MKNTREIVKIDDMTVKLHQSVYTYIREYNARIAEETIINKRFKEFARFVDRVVCRSFKYPTTSMIKYSYSFNHYATRDKIINKYRNNKCKAYKKEKELWRNQTENLI